MFSFVAQATLLCLHHWHTYNLQCFPKMFLTWEEQTDTKFCTGGGEVRESSALTRDCHSVEYSRLGILCDCQVLCSEISAPSDRKPLLPTDRSWVLSTCHSWNWCCFYSTPQQWELLLSEMSGLEITMPFTVWAQTFQWVYIQNFSSLPAVYDLDPMAKSPKLPEPWSFPGFQIPRLALSQTLSGNKCLWLWSN
jgi:hypothetical protein